MRFATKSALLIALIAGLLSYAKFDHCRTNGWGGPGTYVHACYSDLPALYLERKLNNHQWPYKDGKDSVEYPPGVAMVMWFTSFAVNHDYNQYRAYFDINALLIFVLFIFMVILLKKMSPEYWYLAPLAPAVIGSLFINWDLWAVLPALLSIYWFDQKRYQRSALALGLAIATKFFPIVLLLPATLILLKRKENTIRYNALALGTWIAINLPFALTTPQGWWRFYKLNLERGVDWGSIWHALSIFGIKTTALNYFATISFVIGAIAYALYLYGEKEPPTLASASFLIVAIFVTASKVYSPQYILWLTPLAVLAIKNKDEVKAFWAWQITELIYHIAIWQHIALTYGARFGVTDTVYAIAVVIRIAGLTYFATSLFRTISHKSPADLAPQPG